MEDKVTIKNISKNKFDELEFTVNIRDFSESLHKDINSEERLSEIILNKVAERFVEENYDNVLEFIDIPKIANKVGILIQNKLSIEILRKELEVGFLNKDDVDKDIIDGVNGKKYLCEDK